MGWLTSATQHSNEPKTEETMGLSGGMRDQIIEGIKRLEDLLDRLPEKAAKDVRQKIKELRKLLVEQRAPRLVLVGRRGSGKSSLINAIFGAVVASVGHVKSHTGSPTWFPFQGELGTIEILDTRGLQEGSPPDEHDPAATPTKSVLAALRAKTPDAVLFLIKATEVDAAIHGDLEQLALISKEIEQLAGFKIPVVAVVTHCDQLEPQDTPLHCPVDQDVEEWEEKQSRVKATEDHIRRKIHDYDQLRDQLVTVIGVCSYQSWRRDHTKRTDKRWRIEELLDFLFRELPEEAKVELARLARVKKLQRVIANKITTITATICGALAAVPIPWVDIAPITGLQVSLITGVAYVSGRDITIKTAGEFLVAIGLNVGAAVGLRELARGLIKWVFPAAGSAVSAGVAYAGTVAIGKAAIAYFIDEVDHKEAAQVFQTARKPKSGTPTPLPS